MSKEYKRGVRDTVLYGLGGLAWLAIVMKSLAIMLMA